MVLCVVLPTCWCVCVSVCACVEDRTDRPHATSKVLGFEFTEYVSVLLWCLVLYTRLRCVELVDI